MSTHSISPQQDQQRQDQIVHRFYIKTVEVLIEARLASVNGSDATERKISGQTEDGRLLGGASSVGKSKKELRIDKWVSRFERYLTLNGYTDRYCAAACHSLTCPYRTQRSSDQI